MASERRTPSHSKPPSVTPQPTAQSEPDVRKSTPQAFGITWFGPQAEVIEAQLTGSSLTIGREPANAIVLSGSEVSRRHAHLTKLDRDWGIADAGSRNGVWLNGRLEQQARLRVGDVLRLGDWAGIVVGAPTGALREVAPGLWGSAQLDRALALVRVGAPSSLNLLITGETGTGKELVAKAAFGLSGLNGAFIPVNCAALSEMLAEAELFGHVRGAFTGAVTDRLGHVREADGGILFLDEVGELPLGSQGKLLRVLQEQEVTPVGSSKRMPVRVRVIAATHRDLRRMVQTGAFRADLLARLQGLEARLPPLRERREDILPLFLGFVRARLPAPPRLSPELASALLLQSWSGNVRELKQLADRSAVLHPAAHKWTLNEVELPASDSASEAESRPPALLVPPRAPGPAELTSALSSAHGVVAQAARSLKISKQTFYKLLEKHDVDVRPYRSSNRG